MFADAKGGRRPETCCAAGCLIDLRDRVRLVSPRYPSLARDSQGGCAREPRDADGAAAILTPAYARWRAVQDDICQDWDRAYTLMLATRPTTATGATALIGAFLQYERALGTELENVAPLLQSLLAFLEGCEAAKAGRHRTLSPRRNEMQA